MSSADYAGRLVTQRGASPYIPARPRRTVFLFRFELIDYLISRATSAFERATYPITEMDHPLFPIGYRT